MKSNTLAILILAYCILVACTRTSPNAQLVQADSLMQKFPDSALRFLQKIRPEELNSLEDRAYHALLLTEVKDKNFIQQTEDSQIRIAVQYYDSIKDIPMQAKSYYYWGCIRRDQKMQRPHQRTYGYPACRRAVAEPGIRKQSAAPWPRAVRSSPPD